jgi:hypothetical protein
MPKRANGFEGKDRHFYARFAPEGGTREQRKDMRKAGIYAPPKIYIDGRFKHGHLKSAVQHGVAKAWMGNVTARNALARMTYDNF